MLKSPLTTVLKHPGSWFCSEDPGYSNFKQIHWSKLFCLAVMLFQDSTTTINKIGQYIQLDFDHYFIVDNSFLNF